MIDLLDNTPNQSRKFRTINCAEINDVSRGKYTSGNQIRFKSSMFRSS